MLQVRQAEQTDHKTIMAIAKQSKYTRDYSNMIFSSKDCYEAGRIRVATFAGNIVGFTCFRHRVRSPATVLYFIGVDKDTQKKGIGGFLMEDLERLAPTGLVELKVMKENAAVEFYLRLGYKVLGDAYDGKGWLMQKARSGSPKRA